MNLTSCMQITCFEVVNKRESPQEKVDRTKAKTETFEERRAALGDEAASSPVS